MIQSTSPSWRTNLSPRAEKKLDTWLKANGYGSYFDMDFTPLPQLPMGVCIEFCYSNKLPFTITEKTKNPTEKLEDIMTEFLEAAN